MMHPPCHQMFPMCTTNTLSLCTLLQAHCYLHTAMKRSRKTLTLEQKLEVLKRTDKGQKTSVIVNTLKMNESTIRSIRSNTDKIRASVKAGTPMNGCKSSYAHPVEMQRIENVTHIERPSKQDPPIHKFQLNSRQGKINLRQFGSRR
uniref:HTH psq-type domain-containing protein n=1 Tax=Scylla olivacea TaxID=85551 RepID=A0A0P4WAJ5_SCYOL